MWDYQEFTQEFDDCPRRMYTLHGVEKLVQPSWFCEGKSYDVYVFQFGIIMQLQATTSHSAEFGEWRSCKVTKLDRTNREWCIECYHRMSTVFVQFGTNDAHLCDLCYDNTRSLAHTSHPTPAPKTVGGGYTVFTNPSCTMWVRTLHKGDGITQHYHSIMKKEDCVGCKYAVLAYRAAYMKWLCDHVLDSRNCHRDVKPVVMMDVLSGIDNKWNVPQPSWVKNRSSWLRVSSLRDHAILYFLHSWARLRSGIDNSWRPSLPNHHCVSCLAYLARATASC